MVVQSFQQLPFTSKTSHSLLSLNYVKSYSNTLSSQVVLIVACSPQVSLYGTLMAPQLSHLHLHQMSGK